MGSQSASAQVEVVREPDDKKRNSIKVIRIDTEAPPKAATPESIEKPPPKRPLTDKPVFKTSAQPPDSPVVEQAMVVLDGSGSMWGQIDGTPKIQTARYVITEIMHDWDPSLELGLMSYGHRAKGDCSDIETLIAPIEVDVARFEAAVNDINPKGKTPITQSVINAAETLKYTEHKATVILISDGEETCNMDPCDAGVTLERYGVDFTTHVISFDVPEEQTIGLRCLAEKTGGMYLEAGNAQSLKTAMQQAVEVTTDKSALTVEPVSLAAPTSLVGGAIFEVTWAGTSNAYDRLVVVDQNDTLHTTRYVPASGNDQHAIQLDAPETPGNYRLQYRTRDHHILGESAFTVVAAEATIEAIPEIVAGSDFEVHWTGPSNRFDELRIIDDQGKSFGRRYLNGNGTTLGSPTKLAAPDAPGRYEVIYETRADKALARVPLVIVATTASIRAPASVSAGAPVDVHWTGPSNRHDEIRILDDQGKSYASRYVRGNGVSIDSPVQLVAPEAPGTYQVVYETRSNKVLSSTPLTVMPADASVTVDSPVIAGSPVEVHWTGLGNKHDKVTIVNGEGKSVTSKYLKGESPISLTAPEIAGTYEVVYETRLGKTLARWDLQVDKAVATITPPTSVVAGAQAAIAWTGPANLYEKIEIVNEAGKSFDSKYLRPDRAPPESPLLLTAPEVAGVYQVIYKTRKGRTLTSSDLLVEPAHATVSAPSTVTINTPFEVQWTGPANAYDKLKIVDSQGKTLATQYINVNSKRVPPTVTLRAPKTGGSYRMIYETRQKRELASFDLVVQPESALSQ